MFVEGFKEGLRYAGSVAERTTGTNAYKRWQKFLGPAEPELSTIDPLFRAGTYIEPIIIPAFQIALPGVTELIPKLITEPPGDIWSLYRITLPPVNIDMATWVVALYSYEMGYELWQIIALKLAANAAAHVGMDLAGRAVDRITKFRPPTTATLAV